MKKHDTKAMVGLALFTAIVVVLQFVGSSIKLGPFSISLVLVPIVVGAAVYGYGAGAWLGFVFGVVVLLSGDAAPFLPVSPLGTIATVIVKGSLAGLCAGLVYKLLEKVNTYLAVAVAAVVCPVVNTGVFLLGCMLFFYDTVAAWGASAGFPDFGNYLIFGMVGVNFLAELAIDIILSPVIVRIINVGRRYTGRGDKK